jgi:hypothetical protein
MIEHFPLDTSRLVCLTIQYWGGKYERLQRHLCLAGDDHNEPGLVAILAGRIRLPFRAQNLMPGGGGRLPFAAKRYGWFVRPYDGAGDGVPLATYDVLGAELEGVFDFAVPSFADGVYRGRIQAIDAAGNVIASPECFPPFRFWSDVHGTAKTILLIVRQTNTYEWVHEADPYGLDLPPTYHGAVDELLPMLARPRPMNLTPYGDIPSPAKPTDYARFNIGVATEAGNRMYPTVTERGITVSENAQLYYFSDGPTSLIQSAFPTTHLVDGEHGVATVGFTLHAWEGRLRKWYHATPWSKRVADSRGKIRTLFGSTASTPRTTSTDRRGREGRAASVVRHPRRQWPNTTRPRAQQYPLRSWFEFFLRRNRRAGHRNAGEGLDDAGGRVSASEGL